MSKWSAWNTEMIESSQIYVNGITFIGAEEQDIPFIDLDEISMKILEFKNKIYDKFGIDIDVNEIRFDLNGSTAGIAMVDSKNIRINTQIYKENKNEYIYERTLGHEYAHIVNAYLYNGRGHDLGWRRIMHFFGLEDSRCHSYNVEHLVKRHKKPYVYVCNCSEFHFTQRMHNSIIRGRWRKCKRCGETLKFKCKEYA